MAEEPENKEQPEGAEAEAKESKGKSPLMTYLIFGGGGLVLVVAIAFATLMFLGGDAPPSAEHAEGLTDSATVADSSHADQNDHSDGEPDLHGDESYAEIDEEALLDSLMAGDDEFIDHIMDNLAFLDGAPDESEIAEDVQEVARQDSLKQVNWLDEEKAALAARETDLAQREKALAKLDKDVSGKVLKIDQAKTSRINNLAKLYDCMDPRSVAQLMANLDDATVVSLIPRMKTKNASAVLALMPPKRAAKLSKQMITIAGN